MGNISQPVLQIADENGTRQSNGLGVNLPTRVLDLRIPYPPMILPQHRR
jgi:hypothetical protein